MIMAAQIGPLVCSLASQGPGRHSALLLVCVCLLCYLPAPLHRSKHPQMLFPAKDHVLKCPAAVTMTTPRGRGKGETARYEKRKLGQRRSKTSTSSSSAQRKLHLQRVGASALAGQHRSLPTNWFVKWFGFCVMSTSICYCVQILPLGNNFLQQCHLIFFPIDADKSVDLDVLQASNWSCH